MPFRSQLEVLCLAITRPSTPTDFLYPIALAITLLVIILVSKRPWDSLVWTLVIAIPLLGLCLV